MKKALFILGELNNDDLDWMVEQGNARALVTEETLIYEGKNINALYIVLSGTLSVFIESEPTKELARISSGEVVGEISFLDTRLPLATVKAVEPSIVLEVSRFQLLNKLERDTGFAARFYRGISLCLSDRMRGTVRRLGYGLQLQTPDPEPDEEAGLSPDDRDKLDLARVKFKWLVQRAAN